MSEVNRIGDQFRRAFAGQAWHGPSVMSITNNSQTTYSSVYVTLYGGVQHDLYHAGQIAILKKALGI